MTETPPAPDADRPVEDGYDLVVTSRQDGRRRAGRAHPAVPTPHRSAAFTPEEIEALCRDPVLDVRFLG